MQAILLVGGLGTRLRPLTLTTPKQMLPLVDRPMIEHVVDGFVNHGIDTVVLSVGYRADAFRAAYPDGRCGGVELLYAEEPEPLDTAGATRFAFSSCLASSQSRSAAHTGPLVVANGDVISDVDITALVELHRRSDAEATIHLTSVDDPSRYGVVSTDSQGRVTGFHEKPDAAAATALGTSWVSAGTYVIERAAINRIPSGRAVSLEREIFPAMAARGALWAMPQDCYWLDAGTPQAYLRAQSDLLEGQRRPRRDLSPASQQVSQQASQLASRRVRADAAVRHDRRDSAQPKIASAATVVDSAISASATVSQHAVIAASAVAEDAAVGEFAAVHSSVLRPGVSVGAYAVVARSAVLERAVVGETAVVRASSVHAGAEIGAGALVEDSVVASGAKIGPAAEVTAGTLIGQGAEVAAGAVLSGARVPMTDSATP